MARLAHVLLSAALMLLVSCYGAYAVRINNPITNGLALDWCRDYGTNCGEPAASEYCRSKGYSGGATAYSEPRRLASGRTRVITNGAICDTRYHVCDTFSWIECGPSTKRFPAPQIDGERIDFCRTFETDCGQPAADAFCQAQNYKTAPAWQRRRLSAGTTLTLGDRAICDTTQHVCDTFSYIICSN